MQDSTKSARASSFNGERLSERKATSGRKATNGRTTTPGRGCVKTSARFQTSLFRSLLRALERSESKNREKSCSARSFTNVEFLHGLGRFDRFATPTRMTAVCAQRATGIDGLCSLTRPPNLGSDSPRSLSGPPVFLRAMIRGRAPITTSYARARRSQCEPDTPALARHCDRCVGQRPRVFLMCAWVRPLVRVPRGAGRVTAARPRALTRRPRPTPRPLPSTGIHKLYERWSRPI